VLPKELLLIFLLISMELMITSPHLVSMVWLLELLVINDVLSMYWHHYLILWIPRDSLLNLDYTHGKDHLVEKIPAPRSELQIVLHIPQGQEGLFLAMLSQRGCSVV